ncbi:Rho family GTPase [Entamoeba histolytica]
MAEDIANYFNSISSSNEWGKYLEDADVREKAEALQNAMLAFSDMNTGAGKIENGKKALKIVVVGDGAVGKTCLLLAFSKGEIPTAYVPTVFENFSHVMKYKNEEFILHLWDTAGQEEYDRLRPLSYADSDVVLLCFAVNNRTSFDNISTKWEPEIKHYIDTAKTVLVGLKVDLRKDGSDDVTKQEGDDLCQKLGCVAYIEASSVAKIGLNEVFEKSVDCIFSNKPVPKASVTTQAKSQENTQQKKKSKCLLQ